MPTTSAPLEALLTFINSNNLHNRDYFVYFAPFTNLKFYFMSLDKYLKSVLSHLNFLDESISYKMKHSEDFLDDSEELFADYNSLGFILASIRDILKEFEKDGK